MLMNFMKTDDATSPWFLAPSRLRQNNVRNEYLEKIICSEQCLRYGSRFVRGDSFASWCRPHWRRDLPASFTQHNDLSRTGQNLFETAAYHFQREVHDLRQAIFLSGRQPGVRATLVRTERIDSGARYAQRSLCRDGGRQHLCVRCRWAESHRLVVAEFYESCERSQRYLVRSDRAAMRCLSQTRESLELRSLIPRTTLCTWWSGRRRPRPEIPAMCNGCTH